MHQTWCTRPDATRVDAPELMHQSWCTRADAVELIHMDKVDKDMTFLELRSSLLNIIYHRLPLWPKGSPIWELCWLFGLPNPSPPAPNLGNFIDFFSCKRWRCHYKFFQRVLFHENLDQAEVSDPPCIQMINCIKCIVFLIYPDDSNYIKCVILNISGW